MPYGKGLLYEKFLELKAKLEQKGYFDASIKKPIPERVKRIGVVTSATGAVIQDIIDVTTRRNNGVDIVLYPVKVQGIGAEFEIANGINFFSEYNNVDCVIVARGGGSIEDLQPFNTEVVANATYNCKKPLVSAVGHETDFTIIDFCSDLRAPTPSAAAELVVYEKIKDYEAVNLIVERCEDLINDKLEKIDKNIEDYVDVICKDMQSKIKVYKIGLDGVVANNYANINNLLTQKEYKLNLINGVISKQNPEMLIEKGYVKVRKNKTSVNSVKNLNLQDSLEIEFKDGIINASVTEIREN
jgi:exodeoxyribonuclease VII large subunit